MFPKETLKRELADELMDIIDSEFFAGALYELCMATFTATVSGFLSDQLATSQTQKSSNML